MMQQIPSEIWKRSKNVRDMFGGIEKTMALTGELLYLYYMIQTYNIEVMFIWSFFSFYLYNTYNVSMAPLILSVRARMVFFFLLSDGNR